MNIITGYKCGCSIKTTDEILEFIEQILAQHYYVKYHWDYNDIDMEMEYKVGTEEHYLKYQNYEIKRVKEKDDTDIFIETIIEELKDWYCLPIGEFHKPLSLERDNLIFISFDIVNECFNKLTTEDEVDIEEEFANLINFKNIVDYVKTHSIDEIMKKFPCELGNDDYFYWFI